MADKGKRIASRQAQLKRRKRKSKNRTQQFDVGPSEPAVSVPETKRSTDTIDPVGKEAVTSEAISNSLEDSSREVRSVARRSPPNRAEARAATAATYPYLGVELRYIGVLTLVLVGVLVVLTYLLG